MTLYHLPTLPKPEPVDHGNPPDTYERGRVCRTDGCSTRLSIYNPTSKCWQCGGWEDEARPILRLLEGSARAA